MKLRMAEKFADFAGFSRIFSGRQQLLFQPKDIKKRENSISLIFDAFQYLYGLFLSLLFLWYTLPRNFTWSGNLLPEAGEHIGKGENSWDARYLRIDFVPSFESECAGTRGVVQVKPRTPSHFNQALGHKLNSTPPPEERSYDERVNAISPSITEQLYELTYNCNYVYRQASTKEDRYRVRKMLQWKPRKPIFDKNLFVAKIVHLFSRKIRKSRTLFDCDILWERKICIWIFWAALMRRKKTWDVSSVERDDESANIYISPLLNENRAPVYQLEPSCKNASCTKDGTQRTEATRREKKSHKRQRMKWKLDNESARQLYRMKMELRKLI